MTAGRPGEGRSLACDSTPLAERGQNDAATPDTSYWAESRRPLASLIFIAPLLLVYEAGVLVDRRETANGVDEALRNLLAVLGFRQYFLLPVLTVCILLGWHHLSRQPWRVSRGVIWGMAGESVVLAVCLWCLLRFQGILSHALASTIPLSIAGGLPGKLVSYLGAGIYEELFFRLILLSATVWLFRRLNLRPGASMAAAVLTTSLLFAIAHHIGSNGEPFAWFPFCFRILAGAFFSLVFVYRGFGIVAGTHAGYDILIGICKLLQPA